MLKERETSVRRRRLDRRRIRAMAHHAAIPFCGRMNWDYISANRVSVDPMSVLDVAKPDWMSEDLDLLSDASRKFFERECVPHIERWEDQGGG